MMGTVNVLTDALSTTALPIKMFHPASDQFGHLIESNICAKPTIDDTRKRKNVSRLPLYSGCRRGSAMQKSHDGYNLYQIADIFTGK